MSVFYGPCYCTNVKKIRVVQWCKEGVKFKHPSEHPQGVGSVATETFDLILNEQHLHKISTCYYNFDTELDFNLSIHTNAPIFYCLFHVCMYVYIVVYMVISKHLRAHLAMCIFCF